VGHRTRRRQSGAADEPPATATYTRSTTVAGPHAGTGFEKLICAAKGAGRTGVRRLETATRHAAVWTLGIASGEHGMLPGNHCLQSHPPVSSDRPPVKRFALLLRSPRDPHPP